MKIFFGHLWAILRFSGLTWQGRFGILLYFVILGLELASIPVSIRMISWTNDFYSALEAFDADEAVYQIGVFGILIGVYASLSLASDYLRKSLVMKWRVAMTSRLIDRWFANKSYWRLQLGFKGVHVDNPDQRIAEDCRLFVESFIRETHDLITSVTGLFSYIALLWSLSAFPLAFSLAGLEIEIPRYMVWAAFLYVILASGLTHLLGYPLKSLSFLQQRREADFRFGLVRVRENADAIALAESEAAETKQLMSRLGGITDNWKRLIFREFLLGCFKTPYSFTILRIPLLLALPAYFGGYVKLGGLMQLASAFQRVVTTLSWFIFAYNRLAEFAATTTRLGKLLDSLKEVEIGQSEVTYGPSQNAAVKGEALSLLTPEGALLDLPENLAFEAGEHVWISGPSGAGKSTLFKTLAGFWPFAGGDIRFPIGTQRMFMPQEPFLPADYLKSAGMYPYPDADISDQLFAEYLEQVGLPNLALKFREGLDVEVAGLSRGERQRLAFIRVLIRKPDWLFLDEATSAIDPVAENHLFNSLRQHCPKMTIVMISHRRPVGLEHKRHLDVSPAAA